MFQMRLAHILAWEEIQSYRTAVIQKQLRAVLRRFITGDIRPDFADRIQYHMMGYLAERYGIRTMHSLVEVSQTGSDIINVTLDRPALDKLLMHSIEGFYTLDSRLEPTEATNWLEYTHFMFKNNQLEPQDHVIIGRFYYGKGDREVKINTSFMGYDVPVSRGLFCFETEFVFDVDLYPGLSTYLDLGYQMESRYYQTWEEAERSHHHLVEKAQEFLTAKTRLRNCLLARMEKMKRLRFLAEQAEEALFM